MPLNDDAPGTRIHRAGMKHATSTFRFAARLAMLVCLPGSLYAQAATPTPTPSPTPPPMPVALPDGWNFWAVLISVLVLALAIFLGLHVFGQRAASSSPAPDRDEGFFRNRIANTVLCVSLGGLVLLAFTVILTSSLVPAATKDAKDVLNTLLPVIGTWVGTLLAYYFSKENFEAATKSVTETARTFAAGDEKLRSVPVTSKWIVKADMKTLPGLVGPLDTSDYKLGDLRKFAAAPENKGVDRAPVLNADGTAAAAVHFSLVEKFLARYYLPDDAAAKAAGLPAVADVAIKHMWGIEEYRRILRGSYGLVRETATLADAKSAMDSADGRLGTDGGVFDVFVTADGQADKPVLGWITNNIIRANTVA